MDSKIDAVVIPAARELVNGFKVRRALPTVRRRMVGPFIFFDVMGPEEFESGAGLDVPPHPHIGLSTVTYLFDGELLHRDSVGSEQLIAPGDVNWMTAGSGIAHSERSPERSGARKLSGVQAWVALPLSHEETAPEFTHHAASELPLMQADGVGMRIIAGELFGLTAPVRTLSPLFYADAQFAAGATLELPDTYPERGLYVTRGSVMIDGADYGSGTMVVLKPDTPVMLRTTVDTRLMLFGGEPFAERRYIWWNFVSSSRERIEQAKHDWRERKFALIPGDSVDFVPLPPSGPVIADYP